jgi:flagellar biogenesis protein FliO
METSFNIMRVILVLIGIIAGMVFLYRLTVKYKFNFKPKDTTEYGLKKLDTIHLGYKKFISVVEVKDYVLVLGVGEKEMSLLAKWKKEDKAT